jgi:uncharacterized protein (DUF1015 family)
MHCFSAIHNTFKKLGIAIPKILLPAKGISLEKWAVVACDQYTSQPEYWDEVEKNIEDSPSTFHLVLPEVYLEDNNVNERISRINSNMQAYLKSNVLIPQKPGFIYINRKTGSVNSRKGLLFAIDLEKYCYNKGSQTLIRATEGTVLERIPPRVKIRENASIELPHIMLLIDDADKSVIEPLAGKTGDFEKLYDFDLMMGGGHIEGYLIQNASTLSEIAEAFGRLAHPATFKTRYGIDSDKGVLLFAVGDGNHSLAAAKTHWENIKPAITEEEARTHPARFALVEVVNLHDEGLIFEPIHRVVFDINPKLVIAGMNSFFSSYSQTIHEPYGSLDNLRKRLNSLDKINGSHIIPYISKEQWGLFILKNPRFNLEVGTLQNFLDQLVSKNPETRIDYIHGKDVLTSLCLKDGNIGFCMPSMDKCDLFKTIILEGALPRKTFSIGKASEKRYYLESRKIIRD